eukprot:g18504.t1
MAGRSSRSSGKSNERIQALVESKLAEGLQYEALQLYRGVVSRKSARGNDEAALAIAEEGIGVLLGKGYADSATELGNVLVGILSDHELPPTEERVRVIKRVNKMYEDAKRAAVLEEEDRRAATQEKEGWSASTGEKEPARGMYSIGVLQGRFLKLAVAWTAARGQRLSGDPELCGLLGRCLWNEGELDRGTRYLVLGERPQELCDLILQDVSVGNARELAVAKGVLQFASKASLRDANALLDAYKNQTVGGKTPTKGVLGFCALLLKTCEYDAAPVFQKLLESYRGDLAVDESLIGFVESIALTYFNLRLRPPSMLDNIMGMLGGMPK